MEEKMATKLNQSYVYAVPRTAGRYWTIPSFLELWFETDPDKEAFVFVSPGNVRNVLTWRQLFLSSRIFARALVQLGVKRGDVIGITLQNEPEWLYATFGAMMAGAIPFSIAFTYADGSDVIGLLKKVENCTTYILNPFCRDGIWDIFKTFLKSYKSNGEVCFKEVPSVKRLLMTSVPEGEQLKTMADVMGDAKDDVKLPQTDPDDVAMLFLTSGSTGLSKAVAHTHHALVSAYYGLNVYRPTDRQYNDRQFGWIGGFPFHVIDQGGLRVCRGPRKPGEKAISPMEFLLDVLRSENCTVMSTSIPMIEHLLALKEPLKGDQPRLRLIITGGQPMAKVFASAAGTICDQVMCSYGSTEGLFCTGQMIDNQETFIEYSSGRPFAGIEIKIVNEAGCMLPLGEKGEMHLRGKSVFQEYYKDPMKTAEKKTVGGWYKTGDIGFLTESGDVIVEGRKSDVIICGGINVYPSILESLFTTFPGVMNAIVVAVPHQVLFQQVCVCALVKPGSDVTDASLRKLCEDYHLDHDHQYSVLPAHYLIFNEFPQTSTGKTSRKILAEKAIDRLREKEKCGI